MTPRWRRRLIWLVAVALFAAALAYVAATFQWSAAFSLLGHLDIALFVGGSSLFLVAYWLVRALRWRLLMQGMGVRCRFVSLYLCSSVALSLSVLTPLQSGEVLKVELLRKCEGAGRLPGYSAFVIERVADLYAIVALGLVAATAAAFSTAWAAGVAAALLLLPLCAYPLLSALPASGRLGAFADQVRASVQSPVVLASFIALTFAGWLFVAAAWNACLCSVSICLGPMELVGLLALVTLATILSFVPAGLGIAEAGTSGLLIHYGVDPPLAQAGALALRGFSVLVIALGALHLLWLRLHWRDR